LDTFIEWLPNVYFIPTVYMVVTASNIQVGDQFTNIHVYQEEWLQD